MRRALDTVLALVLAAWLALGATPAAFAASPGAPKSAPTPPSRGAGLGSGNHHASARVTFVALTQKGHERRGTHFTADRVRILKIEVEWLTLAGAHTQRLELITPDGSIYQRFTTEVESVTGRAYVETRVPVAGTWITQYSLEGRWEVNVYLDDAVTPVATASFTLAK